MRERGSINILILLFILFFSSIILISLFSSFLLFKATSLKKSSTILNFLSEAGMKYTLDKFIQNLEKINLHELNDQAEIDDPVILLEGILGEKFPNHNSQAWREGRWDCSQELKTKNKERNEIFNQYTIEFKSISKSSWKNLSFNAQWETKGFFILFDGKIPLSFLPFSTLKDTKNLHQNYENISIRAPQKILTEKFYFEEKFIPEDASFQLLNCLKIKKINSPESIDYRTIRKILGMEEIDAPPEEGVYLIENQDGMGGIFCEGDLDSIILAIDESFQVIGFFQKDKIWVLKYSKKENKTIFSEPATRAELNGVPEEIIIINGKVNALGGGTINPQGIPVFYQDEPIESLTQDSNITIAASDKITIKSDITGKGLRWEKDFPFYDKSKGILGIFVSGRDFFNFEKKEGIIKIENEKGKTTVDANLISEKIIFENETKLIGSIQGHEINSPFKIEIFPYDLTRNYPKFFPISPKRLLYLSSFQFLYWRNSQI
ncbi:MAG: hypothetical protein AB1410_01045 [Acidobacteriota bacterium]